MEAATHEINVMVNSESEVIPSPAGLHAGNVDEVLPTDDLDSVLRSRSSRPHLDDGWIDDDHYFEDSNGNGNNDGETETPASDDASVSDSNGEGNTDGETETPTGSSVSMDSNDDEETGQLVQESLRN